MGVLFPAPWWEIKPTVNDHGQYQDKDTAGGNEKKRRKAGENKGNHDVSLEFHSTRVLSTDFLNLWSWNWTFK